MRLRVSYSLYKNNENRFSPHRVDLDFNVHCQVPLNSSGVRLEVRLHRKILPHAPAKNSNRVNNFSFAMTVYSASVARSVAGAGRHMQVYLLVLRILTVRD